MAVATKTQIVQIDWFAKPVQIKFYDADNGQWVGGIGYKDEIICCKCGSVIKITDMYDPEILILEPNPIQILGDWADISKYMF